MNSEIGSTLGVATDHIHPTPEEREECEICKVKIPFKLPKEIVDAAINRKLVIFAGAGVSTESRDAFSTTLYADISGELNVGGKKRISFSDLMSLYCKRKSRRMLLQRIKKRFDYMKLFPEIYRDASRFHSELSTIHYIEEIITTNWDDHFERECDATPIVTPDDFAVFSDILGRRVIKLHGSVSNYGSIVATEEDYQACYRRLRSGVIGSVLRVLLASKVVVFVGYSFGDEDFRRIYRLLSREVKQLLPRAYLITLDKDAQKTVNTMKMNVIPIVTDATYFLAVLKEELVGQKLMLPDVMFDGLQTVYYRVSKAQDKIYGIDLRVHPENFYSLVYQDGMMHGLEDVMGSRKSGRFSHPHTIFHLMKSYEFRRTMYSAKHNYKEVAYIDGFLAGLMCLISSDEQRARVPLFYLFGCGDITSLEDYTRLAKGSHSLHKSAYSYAEKMAKYVPSGNVSFHHKPFL